MGQLNLELYELYGKRVWFELSGIANSVDLADIFLAVANTADAINMTKYVDPPAGANINRYFENYHNVVITNVIDGETIEVGTMEILKQIQVGYTHMTRGS